ncbi:hypothetical protein [Sorangium sp. So ce388]|uniref:hypothetical protein n=1 Tax=Sorangium sp. So ce388 TaxID=3133309 RepID=UPI003F5C020F
MKPHFIGPDAALVDEVGDPGPWLRLQQARIKRDLMSDPAWLRGRVQRLAARLREEGGEPGEVVTAEGTAALLAEVLRLEGEIGAALNRKRESVVGLDEPGAGEALAAE